MGDKQDNLHKKRHSLAHIMASAVQELWPHAKFGVGPTVDNGFYYDIDLGKTTISEDDFVKLEKQMQQIIDANEVFEKFELSIEDAIKWAEETKQPYKKELLNDLKKVGTTNTKDINPQELGIESVTKQQISKVTFYKCGNFVDLCRGPHVASSSDVGAFKLTKVAGAFWRGKDDNPQMQRLYGVAFETKEELDKYLYMVEESKERDHRKLGQELDLFVFSDLIGQGLPLFTPRGTIIRNEIDKYIQEMRDEYEFQEVTIPHITKKDAYVKSGHWDKFNDELFKITTREGHELAMKPMNCPHHAQIYASQPRSYKELPIRYRETTMVYRDEQTGELSGLSRVRSITQDDAHVFCRDSQIEEEIEKIWDIIERFYSTLGIKLKLRLSTHDSDNMDNYLGNEKQWQKAEKQLKTVVDKKRTDYIDGKGEAAFYGPKIDFIGQDALGREFQASTIQLDFGQPEGFDLNCTNEDGEKERIVMIHCAIAGSLERCLVLLIEHYAGKFPVWIAPQQIRVASVNQEKKTSEFVNKIVEQAKILGLRVGVDNSNESVGKKIRSAELMKIPYTLVIGEKEIESGKVVPRTRKDMQVQNSQEEITFDNFFKTVANEAKSRVTHTSA